MLLWVRYSVIIYILIASFVHGHRLVDVCFNTAGGWADERGRRGALLLTTWLFIIGGLVQALAPTLTVVIAARAVIGVASGASTVLVPIYLGA